MTETPEKTPDAETRPPLTSTVHQIVDKRFLGVTPDDQRIMIDGENHAPTGMRPMQLLLNALGACAGYDIVSMIGKRRLPIEQYRIELEGTRADAVPAGFTHIHARHYLRVPGLDQRMADRFVGLGMTRYCSVSASLRAEITYEVILDESDEPAAAGT